jgi:hypothetical protein
MNITSIQWLPNRVIVQSIQLNYLPLSSTEGKKVGRSSAKTERPEPRWLCCRVQFTSRQASSGCAVGRQALPVLSLSEDPRSSVRSQRPSDLSRLFDLPVPFCW